MAPRRTITNDLFESFRVSSRISSAWVSFRFYQRRREISGFFVLFFNECRDDEKKKPFYSNMPASIEFRFRVRPIPAIDRRYFAARDTFFFSGVFLVHTRSSVSDKIRARPRAGSHNRCTVFIFSFYRKNSVRVVILMCVHGG